MFGMFMVNGYADLVPGFDVARLASPFYWTLEHRPMAGPSDWPAVALVAGLVVIVALVGLYVFQRRDLASVVRVALPGGSRRRGWWVSRWSLTGAGTRSLGERLPDGIGWGVGLGLYGLIIAISSEEFAAVVASLPQMQQMIENFFPGIDMTTAGGLLQLAMFNFASLIVGLAASTFVAGWATDETNRRLELVLAAPMRRFGWALRSGLGLLVAIVLMVVVAAVGIALGVAIVGSPLAGPISGALVLGLYAAALAGIGLLVAGLGWPNRAALVVAAVAIGMWLLEFLGGILNLPDSLINLALTTHLGQPMAGIYNWPGMLLTAAIAVGGLLIGALAFERRDLRG
jgi:ABC-2 type transport system permease protein